MEINDTNNKQPGLLHPSKALYRFIILIFVAFLSFGSYFAYDIVGAIAPTLVDELGAKVKDSTPLFIWKDIPGAKAYHFQIGATPNFIPLYEEAVIPSKTSYSIRKNLSNWNNYYWRVRVQDKNGNWSDWSEAWKIKIELENYTGISLLSPANGITIDSTSTVFSWKSFPKAIQYHFQIADNQYFNPVYEQNDSLTSASYKIQSPLSSGKTYYWRVRAREKDGNWRAWSETRSLNIDLDSSLKPALLTPGKSTSTANNSPGFTWSSLQDAVQYHFQIADNQYFNPVYEQNDSLTSASYKIQSPLSSGKTYYWRVRAREKDGNWRAWSETRDLRIDSNSPPVPALVSPGSGVTRGIVGASYTMYSIAAILALILGGILIDRLGTRKASILFSILVFSGATIVWLSKSVLLLLAGRFIFGAGSEPLIVAQSAILARWFKNKELALSFGIALTVSRLGTLFAFNTGELITSHFGSYSYALFTAVIFCAFSLLCNIVYIIMDRRGERILKLKDESVKERIVLKDLKEFKPTFWYVTLICVTFYSAIFPFTALSTDFFVDKWGIARYAEASGGFFYQVFNNFFHMFSTAGGISSIIIFASMILAPFAGQLVDKIGKRATLMIIGSLIMIPSHLLMGITRIYPAYPMIFLGAAFVLVPAAMWPSVPLIVRKERVGTAFGLMTAVQNIGLATFPFLNGLLRDITKTYTSSMVMFASLGFFGLVFAILLKKADAREEGILERP